MTFHACVQCRERKLKCDRSVDGDGSQPCKRCRRESKQCTLPALKRKRHEPEAALPPNAKRPAVPHGNQKAAAAVRPSSSHVQQPAQPLDANVEVPSDDGDESSSRGFQTTLPVIQSDGGPEEEGDYMVSTAAHWALDFLPVTLAGTIADLSQAVRYQSSEPESKGGSTHTGDAECSATHVRSDKPVG